jgi:hypothetical protein
MTYCQKYQVKVQFFDLIYHFLGSKGFNGHLWLQCTPVVDIDDHFITRLMGGNVQHLLWLVVNENKEIAARLLQHYKKIKQEKTSILSSPRYYQYVTLCSRRGIEVTKFVIYSGIVTCHASIIFCCSPSAFWGRKSFL